MAQSYIRYDSSEGVATITLDRPAKRNALNSAMCGELHEAWLRFSATESDRVAVLTGQGDDIFTAGADLNDPPAQFWQAVPNLGVPVSKPIIAALSGPVVGAGVTMVAMTDLCVASTTTRFVYPEARIGIAVGLVSSIAARIPHKIAMELLILGSTIDVGRAYQAGLVNRVVPPGQQLATAQEMARSIAGNAPLVVAMLKDMVLATLPVSPIESMYRTQRAVDLVLQSDDAKEGPLAFREKREPRFTGR